MENSDFFPKHHLFKTHTIGKTSGLHDILIYKKLLICASDEFIQYVISPLFLHLSEY